MRVWLKSQWFWSLLAAGVTGFAVGGGLFTFVYAKGSSYLTNDPAVCANCHIMQEHYDAWIKSSHRSVATCNDCHTPAGLVPKYLTKAENGFWHSLHFTTGHYPDPLRIKPGNRAVTEQACRKCHALIVAAMDGPHGSGESLSCVRCHSQVGHPLR